MPLSFDLRRKPTLLSPKSRLDKRWKKFDFGLLGIPCFLVALACFLIASTQRQVDYADWYQHLIIAVLGIVFAK